MRCTESPVRIQQTQTLPKTVTTDRTALSDKFWALYSEMLRLQFQYKPEDVVRSLDAAREATEDRYRGLRYRYARVALQRNFDNCVEWLEAGVEPTVILLEALQDERAILDRHNRVQAKAHPQLPSRWSISEESENFPLAFMCLTNRDIKLPASLFQPIYQVEGDPRVPMTDSHKRSFHLTGHRNGKLFNAPSPTHDFPDGNLTLVEIAAFLPQSIKSWDIADRLIWNGASSEDLAILFNKHRDLSPKININSVYLMFRGQMRKRTEAEHGYKYWKQWIVTAHADVQRPDNFDSESISVTGFRRPVIFQKRPDVPADPIPFRDLANGVAVWPEGYDALDLTRCVRWCAEHLEVDFYYPTDYQKVLQRVGSPLNLHPRHSDAHALARLRSETGRTGPRRHAIKDYSKSDFGSDGEDKEDQPTKRKRDGTSRYERSKARQTSAAGSIWQTRSIRSTSVLQPKSQSAHVEVDSGLDTEDEVYQGPKCTEKIHDRPRRSVRNTAKRTSYFGVERPDMDDENEEIQR